MPPMHIRYHHLQIAPKWFGCVENQTKCVDARLGNRDNISAGDVIVFHENNSSNTLFRVVQYVRKYVSFESMLIEEGIQRVLPGVSNLVQGVQLYREFYSEADETNFGALAIGLECAE